MKHYVANKTYILEVFQLEIIKIIQFDVRLKPRTIQFRSALRCRRTKPDPDLISWERRARVRGGVGDVATQQPPPMPPPSHCVPHLRVDRSRLSLSVSPYSIISIAHFHMEDPCRLGAAVSGVTGWLGDGWRIRPGGNCAYTGKENGTSPCAHINRLFDPFSRRPLSLSISLFYALAFAGAPDFS